MAADCYLTLDLPNVRLRALAWGPQDGPLVIC
ncbi:alpha/beta hydrolase, partial [Mycobacteroides abscessus subsp. massiliense]